MNNANKRVQRITFIGVFISLALILSYVETLIPINFGIPGVKLGLANLAVVITMYLINEKSALILNITRIALSSLLFSPGIMFFYSLAGGAFSFTAMWLGKKVGKLSVIGTSVLGGVFHNIGQITVAMIVMETFQIAYYLPILILSGVISGILIGIIARYAIKSLPESFFKDIK